MIGFLLHALLIGSLVFLAISLLKIKVTPVSVTAVTLVVAMTISTVSLATQILWQGIAPVSHQITLTRFVVAMNPDQKALVKSINVEIGEEVKQGDVLFELDKTQFQATVDQYAADLNSSKAEVDRLSAALDLSDATIARLEAQANAAVAERDANQKLLRAGSPAVAELNVLKLTKAAEAAEAAVVEAEASKQQAVFALASGEAKVRSTQGLLDNATADLDRTTYTAPADGVMINWQARPGTITASLRAAAVGTFMETGNERVVAVYPQNLLRNVKPGDDAEIAFKSRPGAVAEGKVLRIANYTGEGQFTASGDVPVLANLGSKGFFAVLIELNDPELAASLGLGEAGSATIYTKSSGIFHAIGKLYMKLISLVYYLP
ncbi:Inner membrane protein YibH [Roseibium album]|nr:Inner membrane protein YibH [Roseibium album]